jgi:hypothetical protein
MLKDIQVKLKNSVCQSSRNFIQNKSQKLINVPQMNFGTDPKRIVDLEKNYRIDGVLKHKSFVKINFLIYCTDIQAHRTYRK